MRFARRSAAASVVYVTLLEPLEQRTLMSGYFVSPTGSDSNPGTSAAPFLTIQKAADLVVAGDSVTVRPGTYAGFSLGWDFPQNGTAKKPIKFDADPGAIITSRNAKTADGIDLEGASFIIVDGFTVRNTSGTITRAGIRSVTNTNVTISNNTADGCGTWGIFSGFSENLTIDHNTAINTIAQHGIYVSNSADNPIVRDNILYGNNDCGLQINADASQGGDGIITGAIIEGNIIHDNGVAGGAAINLDGVQDSIIRNNLLYNNHAGGISLYHIDAAAGSKNNVIANNTIVMPSDGRWDLNITAGSTGNIVFNNILYNAQAFRGSITISSDSTSGFVSDYNLVMDRFSTDDGDTGQSLAAWRSATKQDAHSIIATSASAIFANAAANDYRLTTTSAALNHGTSIFASKSAPITDLLGAARPSGGAWDIGAYELPSTTPDPLASAVNLGSIHGGVVKAVTDSVSTTNRNDYYRFTVTKQTSVQIKLYELTDDADLMILNSAGQQIGYSKHAGAAAEVLTLNLSPSTYYVRVLFKNGITAGTSYRLRLAGE
jgi:parallel beta-helix repeat protein